jgi:CRISPR-associated Csx2 family protein
MTSVLLTFLGRVPKDQPGYRVTRYDFGDGQPQAPAAFFGWPLRQHLDAGRLVILGTAGSMWEHLFEGDHNFGALDEEAWLALGERCEQQEVTAAHLVPLAPLLAQRLGCEVRLALIPYAQDPAEQVELLRIMAAHVEAGDRVHLDVTHGFRHLPMLGILSALHLRSARQARIDGIWYGAYDPDTGAAPVHNLVGLLNIADWVQALHTYDKDGDYGVFPRLMEQTAPVAAEALRQAAFHEKTNNIGQARGALRHFRQAFITSAKDPMLQLFAEELLLRTAWVENSTLTERQYELALHCLDHGDYLRAAILGYEALLTRLVQAAPGRLDPLNHSHRDQIKKDWDEKMRGGKADRTPTQQAYLDLREIRNVLAHGSRSAFGNIQEAMASDDKLRAALAQAIRLAHKGATA